jgi:hypothetical protein
MPADFAGGSVRINTRDFPRQRLFQISVNRGINSEATFRERLTYTGSKTRWLRYDGGTLSALVVLKRSETAPLRLRRHVRRVQPSTSWSTNMHSSATPA